MSQQQKQVHATPQLSQGVQDAHPSSGCTKHTCSDLQVKKAASVTGTFNLVPGIVERRTVGEGEKQVQIRRKYVAARFPEVRPRTTARSQPACGIYKHFILPNLPYFRCLAKWATAAEVLRSIPTSLSCACRRPPDPPCLITSMKTQRRSQGRIAHLHMRSHSSSSP